MCLNDATNEWLFEYIKTIVWKRSSISRLMIMFLNDATNEWFFEYIPTKTISRLIEDRSSISHLFLLSHHFVFVSLRIEFLLKTGLRVEFVLKPDGGYPKDAGAAYPGKTWESPLL